MAYFFLYVSFFAVLFIFYEKIFPLLKNYLSSYQKKIESRLELLEKEHKEYSKELAKLNQDMNKLNIEIDDIIKQGEIDVSKMRKAYNVIINDILQEKRRIADQHIKNIQDRFNQDIRELIASNIKKDLIIWFHNQQSNSKLHSKIYEESIKKIK